MSEAREDAATLLSEYLGTPQSDWVHQEIEGKPDSYRIDVKLSCPKGDALIVRTDAGTIRILINVMVQTIEAASLG